MFHTTLLDRIRHSLDRDRDLPALYKARKALRFGTSAALAPLYLLACDRVGEGARTRGRPVIQNAGHMIVGARAHIGSMFTPTRFSTGPSGTLHIGDDATINFGCTLTAARLVQLGDRVSLGPYVTLDDTDGAPGDTSGPQPIVIGHDVWLAARVRVKKGVTIGDGSVITAGSVVEGPIPPNVIAGGVPARVLKYAGKQAPIDVTAPAAQPPSVAAETAAATSTARSEPIVGAPRADAASLHSTVASLHGPAPLPAAAPQPTAVRLPAAAPQPTAVPQPAAAPQPTAVPQPAAAPQPPEVRGLLLSDFSIQELALHLRAADPLGPRVEGIVMPFGQVVQTLHQLDAEVATHKADFALVWTRPEQLSPFRELLLGQPIRTEDLLAEVDAFASRIATAAASVKHLFVATWVLPPHERGRGMIDLREGGAALALARMNLRLIEALTPTKNVFVLDASRWIGTGARPSTSSRLWLLGKVSFSPDVFAEAAKDLRAALRGLRGAAKKLVVLDLDDTLWGGILGDVGWENLHLGGHEALGEAYVELQHRLKALTRRGVLLAIASKNEASVALEAIAKHPAMVLKESDFAAYRINWRDKAANIADLVSELNLGLQSVVFIDDNPVERARVREALPEVFVPDWPDDKLRYPEALLALRCFDTPSISREDMERTQLYAAERSREALKSEVGSLDDWLASLGMKVRFAKLDPSNVARTTQLFNKTNQMNLSTRRLGEPELTAWASAPGHELWTLSVSDKFGDAGLTGILGLALEPTDTADARDAGGPAAPMQDARDVGPAAPEHGAPVLRITDYILSCRVMGRRVEEAMLAAAVARARSLGAASVVATYLPTAKNKPCLTFFKSSGFDLDEATMTFRSRAGAAYAVSPAIETSGLDFGPAQAPPVEPASSPARDTSPGAPVVPALTATPAAPLAAPPPEAAPVRQEALS